MTFKQISIITGCVLTMFIVAAGAFIADIVVIYLVYLLTASLWWPLALFCIVVVGVPMTALLSVLMFWIIDELYQTAMMA